MTIAQETRDPSIEISIARLQGIIRHTRNLLLDQETKHGWKLRQYMEGKMDAALELLEILDPENDLIV